jgi:CO/xanthine dehydrogenase FAD-binding subunit
VTGATAFAPRSLAEALPLLTASPSPRPVAGCTDLMVTTPLARAALDRVLDVTGIAELRGVREEGDGSVSIGAATTFREIAAAPSVVAHFPALAAAARVVGGWQIQNRATIGGNMANASPAGDSLPVLLAFDAVVECAGPSGPRSIPYAEFHTGYRRTALAPGELIVRVRLPRPPAGTRQAFRKVGTREAQAISKVVVAMRARVENGAIVNLALAAGSVAATPVRLHETEAALLGRPADAASADLAGRTAAAEVAPIDDVRSTAAYRLFALERVVRRLVLSLVGGPP